jgi:peptidoglycan/xylan/chitin deacetylase (PgdA/CDA1 family)
MLSHRLNTLFFAFGVILFFSFRENYGLKWWVLGIIFLVWFGLTIIGSFRIQWNYHLKALHDNKRIKENVIALTFDDGPTLFTSQILDLLKIYNQKATFFCIGKQVEKFPELALRIVKEGHIIGNHTYSHSEKTGWMGVQKMKKEIDEADAIIKKTIGKKPELYRPPFGVTNPSIEKAVKQTGHQVIGWSIRSLDTVIKDQNPILERIVKRLAPGKVVLLHDTSAKTVDVLEKLLKEMSRQSYTSVTADTLFNIKAYEA